MSTQVVSLGTIDLKAFCGCPSPCPDCCINCGACTGLPTTLHATVTGTGVRCTCALGVVWTLTWDAVNNWWIGTHDLSAECPAPPATTGQVLTVKLYCSGGAFVMDILNPGGVCLDTGDQIGIPSFSTACTPLNVVFHPASIKTCCSDLTTGQTVVITVTA